jgi:hypothetical protein
MDNIYFTNRGWQTYEHFQLGILTEIIGRLGLDEDSIKVIINKRSYEVMNLFDLA